MTERPILFSAPMVRAILEGRKTQTRRVVKPPFSDCLNAGIGANINLCPYGQPGDRLWVGETWALKAVNGGVIYRATKHTRSVRWQSSTSMPRWASRITLEIVSVRVERLNEISTGDAKAEGLSRIEYKGESWGFDGGNLTGYGSSTGAYRALWESINGAGSWEANPWVWVVEFKVIAGGE